jgi:branched-chain amino acid transport system substrate-binding protein
MKRRITILTKAIGLMGLVFLILLFAEGRPLGAAEPIKIGAVLSITGRGGFLGTPEKEAITAIVEDVNRQGGVLGRQIEVYFEDDQSSPTNSAIAATKLIRDKNVCCLIGASLVVNCMAVIPVCENEQVTMISITPITVPLKKWIFNVSITDYRLAQMMLNFTVETLGARKLAFLHSTDTYGMNGAQGIMENIDKSGASIVITEKFDPADTSMIPQLTKIKAARPEAIILYANAVPASVIAKNYQQLGMLQIPVIGSGGIPTPDFLRLAGEIVQGGRWIVFGAKDFYVDQIPPDDPYRKDIYDPFMKCIKEKYGKTDWVAFYRNGNDTTKIVIEALKIAKTDDRVALRDAMEKVRYQGFMGNYAYSPTDHSGTKGEAFVPIIIKGGRYTRY